LSSITTGAIAPDDLDARIGELCQLSARHYGRFNAFECPLSDYMQPGLPRIAQDKVSTLFTVQEADASEVGENDFRISFMLGFFDQQRSVRS
jgi:hypothetical protein